MNKEYVDAQTGLLVKLKSDEEVYFVWWLQNLLKEGYVESFQYEEVTYTLLDDCYVKVIEIIEQKSKKKEKVSDLKLLNKTEYTPDFIINWNKKAIDIFIKVINEGTCLTCTDNAGIEVDIVFEGKKSFYLYAIKELQDKWIYKSYIDVKGTFAGVNNNSAATFPLKQKLMWDKYKIYVQKLLVKGPNSVFKKTFTPLRYILSDEGTSPRRMKIKRQLRPITEENGYRTLEEYVSSKKD